MIREDILQKFPELFGTKKVNGREVNIDQTITTLTRELGPEIGILGSYEGPGRNPEPSVA